jgi:hypothetical protein
MNLRIHITTAFALVALGLLSSSHVAPACCPAPPSGKPVVNADQTVIILWDAATKTQHFIRQASFKSEADDFGFIIPTPARPELDESGNEAFPYLRKLTEPARQKVSQSGGMGCGCGRNAPPRAFTTATVTVLEEKLVAGFHAVVLEAAAADALTAWLKDHGYAFSPEVEAWAKPYVEAGWKFTTLKVAKGKDDPTNNTVTASALRLSFQTDRPIFPYREPDPQSAAATLHAKQRLLRIYFLAESRYRGELTKDVAWTGQVAWADKLAATDRAKVLDLLKLPATAGPQDLWLTEFEDNWLYLPAPADVAFAADTNQTPVHRPPIIEYVSAPFPTDASAYALVGVIVLTPLWRRIRRGTRPCPMS